MDIRALNHIDLNLLVALQALFEERSVSRAAERLFITQSAMSKTLGRLRQLFDDPLFTRSGGAMVPTARAEQIAAELTRVLQGVEGIVLPTEFDPQTYEGEFRLEIPQYIALWALPTLCQRLLTGAPGIRLNTVSTTEHHLELMAAGKLDFTVQIEHASYDPQFRVRTMGFAPPRLIARKGHPLEGSEPDWEDILRFPVIRPFVPEAEAAFASFDSIALNHLLNQPPLLHTQHVPAAMEVVRATDCIFPGPPFFIQQRDLSEALITIPIPGGEELMMKFVIVYHERVADSPAHQFLLAQIVAAVNHYRVNAGLPELDELRRARKLAD